MMMVTELAKDTVPQILLLISYSFEFNKTAKVGIKTNQLMAGWDNDYLLKFIDVIKPDCPVTLVQLCSNE